MVNPRDLFRKAQSLAQQRPDQVRGALDKLEDMVDKRTGGKHADKVDKASDFIEGRLGIRRPGGQDQPPPAGPGQPPR